MIKLSKEILNIINELAFNRKYSIANISSLCIPYTEHIIKLAIYGNNQKYSYDILKWKDEIYNFIRQAKDFGKLKNNKKLKPKDYTESLFFGLLETEQEVKEYIEDHTKDLIRNGYDLPHDLNYSYFFKNYKIFIEKVLQNFFSNEYEDIIQLLDMYIIGKLIKD